MKKNKKKATKIIVYILAAAMLLSTFATIFTLGGEKDPTKNITEENLNIESDSNSNPVDTEITESMKNAMENAEVKVGDKNVEATITIDEEMSKIQADKIVEKYSSQLEEIHKGKDIRVNVVSNGQNITTSNTYVNVKTEENVEDDIPSMSVRIKPAITNMDRHVVITLDTDTPEKYTVKVLGQECRYAESKNFFHTVVYTTDENEIKKGIQVILNQ